jgi:Fe-S-cluster containining protein
MSFTLKNTTKKVVVMAKYTFKCSRCGKCCINIVNTIEGIKFGMNLLPHEILLFPENVIHPMFGIGKFIKERNEPEHIFMYQNVSVPCIFYDDLNKSCRVYENRPMVCRAFPLEPSINKILIHRECPEVNKILPENAVITSRDIEGLEQERSVIQTLQMYYITVFIINPEGYDITQTWFYEFEKKRWHKITKDYAYRILTKKGE